MGVEFCGADEGGGDSGEVRFDSKIACFISHRSRKIRI